MDSRITQRFIQAVARCEEETFLPTRTFGTMGKERKPLEGGEKIDGRVDHLVPDPTAYTTYVWAFEW